jgi:hypothetical protein
MFQVAKFGWNGGNGGALNPYNSLAAIRKRASGSGAFSRSLFASSHKPRLQSICPQEGHVKTFLLRFVQ